MQAKDISPAAFLSAVTVCEVIWGHASPSHITRVTNWPIKVVRAKIKTLARQGLISGCGCGCGTSVVVK